MLAGSSSSDESTPECPFSRDIDLTSLRRAGNGGNGAMLNPTLGNQGSSCLLRIGKKKREQKSLSGLFRDSQSLLACCVSLMTFLLSSTLLSCSCYRGPFSSLFLLLLHSPGFSPLSFPSSSSIPLGRKQLVFPDFQGRGEEKKTGTGRVGAHNGKKG